MILMVGLRGTNSLLMDSSLLMEVPNRRMVEVLLNRGSKVLRLRDGRVVRRRVSIRLILVSSRLILSILLVRGMVVIRACSFNSWFYMLVFERVVEFIGGWMISLMMVAWVEIYYDECKAWGVDER
jgi:hypothetical protein